MPPLQIPVCRSSSSSRKRTTILTPNAVVVAAYGHPNKQHKFASISAETSLAGRLTFDVDLSGRRAGPVRGHRGHSQVSGFPDHSLSSHLQLTIEFVPGNLLI